MNAAWAFAEPKSTSNLVQPDVERFLRYAAMPGTVALLEERLAAFHEARHCVSFCNGFWSLVFSIRLLARPARSEVVIPSLTYRRLADAVAWTGLLPRFCEVDPRTLASGAAEMAACIGPQTALLLSVHPIVGCADVPGLVELAKHHGLPLLFDSVESSFEDSASGRVGRFGDAEVFSMHASKLLNGFEGGYVTTEHADVAAALRADRDGGLDMTLPPVHAALALAGLDELDAQVARNRDCYRRYLRRLGHLPGLRVLRFDESRLNSFKTIVVELTEAWPLSRAETLEVLKDRNVLARAYYHPPLHAKPMAYPHVPATLPLTDVLSQRFMLLPCGAHVSAVDVDAICTMLAEMAA